MNSYSERQYLYWLMAVPGIGAVTVGRLLERFQSFEAIYNIEEKVLESEKLLKRKEAEAFAAERPRLAFRAEELKALEREGIQFITILDDGYPERLRRIHGYPPGLFVKGELPSQDHPTAAIIGARDCTNYGRQVAESMAAELARSGVQIISGLAYGIDGAGHAGALKGGGKTYGVLGCGIKTCYPRQNYGLYERMCRQGGVLSEWLPDERPQAKNFPVRNRIISGLSDVILVMEARQQSGSLITAGLGLEQGKEIFALPGRISDPLSEGCNRLISEGAGILLSPQDVLEYFTLRNGKMLRVDEKNENRLAKKEKMVYSCLDLQPKGLEEIVNLSGLSVSECIGVLLELELSGYVVQTSHQYYGKRL